MSSPAGVRRADRVMSEAGIEDLLRDGYCGHLATVGPDGAPYVCPLLYVWLEGRVWLHNTSAPGHLQSNVRHEPRVCFEVALPGTVFPYGRFQCDTAIAYRSVVVFGRVAIGDDRDAKAAFFDALMDKYFRNDPDRPDGFYPRLDAVTVYALTVDRMTGKETALPATELQWPAADNTRSPKEVAPQ
jgi:nitroimidazol reductase NimA-like FMN-containing flavoprotein (pyridoxamine 5'-phosphate oxidase superfamily)